MAWIMVMLIAPFIIGMMGEVVKDLVIPGKMPEKGWPGFRGFFYVTYKAHALAVGALLGLAAAAFNIPWPKDTFGEGAGGGAVAFCFAGGVAMVGYAAIVGVIRNGIRQVGARLGIPSKDDTKDTE